jgi:PadR family transcriptional regulator PadR
MLSLAHTQKHGYAILKDVETLSEGKVQLSNGTLYGALTRLQDQGLIARVSSDEPEGAQPEGQRPRKAYRLTEDGLHVLDAEIGRLQNLVDTARLHLAEGPA